jgi:hypothetical protein
VTQRSNRADHAWAVRARRVGPAESRVHVRNHTFGVGAQASLRERDEHPSAVEYLLGALAGDLLRGFEVEAARRQVALDAGEITLQGRLDNVLVQIGVIGEVGTPALASVSGTFYVSAGAEEWALDEMWNAALARSPLYQTLSRCAEVSIRLRSAP